MKRRDFLKGLGAAVSTPALLSLTLPRAEAVEALTDSTAYTIDWQMDLYRRVADWGFAEVLVVRLIPRGYEWGDLLPNGEVAQEYSCGVKGCKFPETELSSEVLEKMKQKLYRWVKRIDAKENLGIDLEVVRNILDEKIEVL